MKALFAVCLVIVCIVVIYLSYVVSKKNSIPNVIWTYWHDPQKLPTIIQRCIDTWQINNPSYRVIILDNATIKKMFGLDLPTMFPNVEKQPLNDEQKRARYSDFARVLAMSSFGGFWMDSSIICTESLDWVHKVQKKTGAELVGFYSPHTTNKNIPIMENWFFAAIPHSPFLNDWLAEIKYMASFDLESQYVDHIKQMKSFDLQGLEEALPYLVMHLCAAVVLQRNQWKYKLELMDSKLGPFKYLDSAKWELPRSLENLCKEKELQTPLVKMRGVERKYLDENHVACDTHNPHIKYVINK